MGKEGQVVPEMTDEWVETISKRYIELYEKVIGQKFIKETITDEDNFQRVQKAIDTYCPC
jgi:phosphoribosylaminoimidazole-succinocarboxamide synthase